MTVYRHWSGRGDTMLSPRGNWTTGSAALANREASGPLMDSALSRSESPAGAQRTDRTHRAVRSGCPIQPWAVPRHSAARTVDIYPPKKIVHRPLRSSCSLSTVTQSAICVSLVWPRPVPPPRLTGLRVLDVDDLDLGQVEDQVTGHVRLVFTLPDGDLGAGA